MQKKQNRYVGVQTCIAAAAATAGLVGGLARPANAQEIHVTVNGDLVQFVGQAPVQRFGSVLVPLRGVFEKLGATVAYDGASKSILAVRGSTSVQIQIGSLTAQVNGEAKTLSSPASSVNGTTLVPLRFVSEALGAEVKWSAASQTVIISTNGTGGVAAGTTPTAPPVVTTPPVANPGTDADGVPQVTSLTHTEGTAFRAGQTLFVTLKGTPGGTAAFMMPGVAKAQSVGMRESPPGTYIGSYTVPAGVAVKGAAILAAIQKNGKSSPLLQSSDMVTIDGVGPTIRNLSPAPNAALPPGRPLIYGTYSEGVTGISSGATKLLVNGKDVTADATITDAFFSYKPGADLPAGVNTVKVAAGDAAGNVISREWSFKVAQSETFVHGLTFTPVSGSLGAGDTLTVKLLAKTGGKAAFAIGGAVKDQPMREESPGVYTGTYQIKNGESVTAAPLTATYTASTGQVETQTAATTLTVAAGAPKAPVITSPKAGTSVGADTITLTGTAAPNATVQYEVRYQGTLVILPVDGAVTNGEVKADAKGNWSVANVKIAGPRELSRVTYTVRAVTVDAAGQTSEAATLELKK